MPISVPVANSQSEDLVFFMNLSNPTGAGLDQAVGIGTIKAANRGCGFGVGAANLIGFYALCWAGLAAIKWGRRQP